ncbi:MAG: hypothetical protein Rubg2KO_08030 [Rubricoccaceae bacterium]
MIRSALIAALVLLTPLAWAQGNDAHVLSIQNGLVSLDGQVLPNAAPPSLDLNGIDMEYEYSGPVTPVISIDGQAYVFESSRLVRFEESTRSNERVYALGEPMADPSALKEAQMVQLGEAAYMQQVAERDQSLYQLISQEHEMEEEALRQADQIRRMPPGAERDASRDILRSLLSDLLQLKDANRREELARAQERLDAVRAQLELREAMHDDIVEARLRSLCGE